MAKAFELINTINVGAGGSASIDFTSIPSTYTDLFVEFSLRTTLSGGPFHFDDCGLRLNNDTGSNYSATLLRSREGSLVVGAGYSNTMIPLYEASAGDATANVFGNGHVYIANYTSSRYKTLSIDGGSESNNATQVQQGFVAGLWRSSSAVTSIKLYSQNGQNFVQYSSASLYGIKKA
jgi:hypothetical protein